MPGSTVSIPSSFRAAPGVPALRISRPPLCHRCQGYLHIDVECDWWMHTNMNALNAKGRDAFRPLGWQRVTRISEATGSEVRVAGTALTSSMVFVIEDGDSMEVERQAPQTQGGSASSDGRDAKRQKVASGSQGAT